MVDPYSVGMKKRKTVYASLRRARNVYADERLACTSGKGTPYRWPRVKGHTATGGGGIALYHARVTPPPSALGIAVTRGIPGRRQKSAARSCRDLWLRARSGTTGDEPGATAVRNVKPCAVNCYETFFDAVYGIEHETSEDSNLSDRVKWSTTSIDTHRVGSRSSRRSIRFKVTSDVHCCQTASAIDCNSHWRGQVERGRWALRFC